MMAAASLIITIIMGFLFIHILYPPASDAKPVNTFLLKLCLGAGLGIGLTSCLFFLSLWFFSGEFFLVLDLTVLTMLAAAAIYFLKKASPRTAPDSLHADRPSRWGHILAVIFGIQILSSLISFVITFLQDPHGKWDAWLIWNMHARFLYRGGEQWRLLFNGALDWTHLDYPLLLPLSVARGWTALGAESQYVPMLLAFVFLLATIGLLTTALSIMGSRNQGYLGGMLLMGSPFFILLGTFQVADIPIAFFFLATFVLLILAEKRAAEAHRFLFMAGLMAGLSAWTKNEGLLFLLIVFISRLAVLTRIRGWKVSFGQSRWFLTGALPVLIMIMIFKTQLAPPNDLFSGQTLTQIFGRLFDLSRFGEIMKAYLVTAFTFTQGVINIRTGIRFDPAVANIVLLGLYLMLMGIRVQKGDRAGITQGGIVIMLMLTGYFGIYLLTPHDLHWHLTTSLNRLFTQLWPSIIFFALLAARTPEEALLHYREAHEKLPPKKKRKQTAQGGKNT